MKNLSLTIAFFLFFSFILVFSANAKDELFNINGTIKREGTNYIHTFDGVVVGHEAYVIVDGQWLTTSQRTYDYINMSVLNFTTTHPITDLQAGAIQYTVVSTDMILSGVTQILINWRLDFERVFLPTISRNN